MSSLIETLRRHRRAVHPAPPLGPSAHADVILATLARRRTRRPTPPAVLVAAGLALVLLVVALLAGF